MDLLPSQKADVFHVIKSSGINPARVQFIKKLSWNSRQPRWTVLLTGTNYHFTFEQISGRKLAIFSPGREDISETEEAPDWSTFLHYLGLWCSLLDRELNATDPWQELERQKVPFTIDETNKSASQPFTVGEFEQVKKSLNVIQSLLIAYSQDNEQQQKTIKSGVAELIESAKSQDRRTWFYMAIGFLASTAVSMALAPEQTRAVYEALKVGLVGAVKLIGA